MISNRFEFECRTSVRMRYFAQTFLDNKMAPVNAHQRRMILISVIKYLLTTVSTALQLNFVLLVQILVQHQALQQELSQALADNNLALRRYRQLRNRYLRRKKRGNWKNPGRTDKWWRNFLNDTMLPEEWMFNFRMSKENFMALEERLKPHIQPSPDSFRVDTIKKKKKLAMTLYYLKDQGSLRMTSNQFGVSKATLSLTIRKVCFAIKNVLGPELIKFPKTKTDLEQVMYKFEEKFGFPMVAGCVDGTHIPIKQPHENSHDYFCYKMKYSLNVQAICDQEGLFLDVDCSWPGSVHDAKVFANSQVHKLFQEKKLPVVERKLNANDEIAVGPVLLGDPAYPLLPGVLKEYGSCSCNEEVIFNQKLRLVRNQIECAFGRLKARWRILNRPTDLDIEYVPTIVYACFVLHNYCELAKSTLSQEAVNKKIAEDRQMQDCTHHSCKDRLYLYDAKRGNLVRETFKNHFKSSS